MAIPAKLNARIESFLGKKSKSQGGFAPVGEKDLEELSEILRGLIKAKYEEDPDGDLPVSYELIDRTRFENTHWCRIPHAKDDAENDLMHLCTSLRAATANLSIAQGQVDRVQRTLEYGVRERMQEGGVVRFGERTYEGRNPKTDHTALAQEARAILEVFVAANPPEVRSDYKIQEAWEQKAKRALEPKLGMKVKVRAFTPSKSPGKISVSVELFGIEENDKNRRVGFYMDEPAVTSQIKASSPSP